MDTVHELAERSSDEMREEIDCTRSDLANKLEALEDRVMGTVQSAQETVEDSIQVAKDTVATVKRTFDIKHHVEQYPWTMVGGCLVAGLALGTLFQRVCRQPRRQTADRLAGKKIASSASPAPAEQHSNGNIAAAAPVSQNLPPPPAQPGVLDLFDSEIAKVKGIAIGYGMGLARDAIKEAVPQWAPQIDELMNSITTKLGGEPAKQRSK
jgi:ElaB/YqjD/DUF883 family membrane-anchored ribosome-binding protein